MQVKRGFRLTDPIQGVLPGSEDSCGPLVLESLQTLQIRCLFHPLSSSGTLLTYIAGIPSILCVF